MTSLLGSVSPWNASSLPVKSEVFTMTSRPWWSSLLTDFSLHGLSGHTAFPAGPWRYQQPSISINLEYSSSETNHDSLPLRSLGLCSNVCLSEWLLIIPYKKPTSPNHGPTCPQSSLYQLIYPLTLLIDSSTLLLLAMCHMCLWLSLLKNECEIHESKQLHCSLLSPMNMTGTRFGTWMSWRVWRKWRSSKVQLQGSLC